MQLIIQTLLPLMLLIALGIVLKKTIADDSWTSVLRALSDGARDYCYWYCGFLPIVGLYFAFAYAFGRVSIEF